MVALKSFYLPPVRLRSLENTKPSKLGFMAAEAAARGTGVLVPLRYTLADAAPPSLRWAGPKQAWFTIFFPIFLQRAVGRFSVRKTSRPSCASCEAPPRPSRTSCQKLTVTAPVAYLSSRKNATSAKTSAHGLTASRSFLLSSYWFGNRMS